jgi:predicted O-methyltransferase YrrM
MNRIEIINVLIAKNNYKSYLEIGVQAGHCFAAIDCKTKVGVDPDKRSAATHKMTSDYFFNALEKDHTWLFQGAKKKPKFDIIFIDGLHHSEQVIKDIENSLKALNNGGTIVMHVCLPTSKRMQEIPLQEQCEWTGDTWKAFLRMRENQDLEMNVVDCDWGCGIIRPGKQTPFNVLNPTYEGFEVNKKTWMNIISVDQFKEKYL